MANDADPARFDVDEIAQVFGAHDGTVLLLLRTHKDFPNCVALQFPPAQARRLGRQLVTRADGCETVDNRNPPDSSWQRRDYWYCPHCDTAVQSYDRGGHWLHQHSGAVDCDDEFEPSYRPKRRGES